MNPQHTAALRGFDELPDSAGARLPVVAALFGVGPATIWRWSKRGVIPAPSKRGGVALWNVGELRQSMKREG